MRANQYRPDIDGLRAVAVVSVIFFHAGFKYFPGGYVGVDVFFVISGFLITGIVLRELTEDRFSLRKFYVRRVLRILPALVIVSLATIIAGFFLLSPDQYAELGEAIQSTAKISVNHHFKGLQGDYWAQNSVAENPLLHFWSLAVEEQFYVVMPAAIFIMFKISNLNRVVSNSRPAILLFSTMIFIAIASFLYSQWMVREDAAAAFYFLASRAWQLLIGGLLAVWANLSKMPTNYYQTIFWTREVSAFCGIFSIGITVFLFGKNTPFPGFAALLPTAGSILLIYSATNTPTGKTPLISRILSLRPFVFIGLISYSLYLWHWPVFVFLRSLGWYAASLPDVPIALQLLLILCLSAASWRYIEQPFRHTFSQLPNLTVLFSAALILLGGWFAGTTIIHIAREGRPVSQALPPFLKVLAADLRVSPGIRCEGSSVEAEIRQDGGGCIVGSKDIRPIRFALIGDSHARMYTETIDEIARREGISALILARSSCTPLDGPIPSSRPECASLTEATIDYISRSSIKTVILAGYWILMARQIGEEELAASLMRTVHRLRTAGKEVVILRDIPELENDIAAQHSSLMSLRTGGAPVIGPSRKEHETTQAQAELAMSMAAQLEGVQVLDPAAVLCQNQGCLLAINGRSLYRDRHHITDAAAIEFIELFEPLVGRSAPN